MFETAPMVFSVRVGYRLLKTGTYDTLSERHSSSSRRIITCCLLCILSYIVCVGFSIAIIAGIAYGYNYSLAEVLTFTRSDVTVYMRRGQFYDKPDLPDSRRSGMGDDTLFPVNQSAEYEDTSGIRSQPLADTWLQSQDTRRYAEKLTKYSTVKSIENIAFRPQEPIPSKPQVITVYPSPLLATVSWQSGTSEIIMRTYKPHTRTTDDEYLTPEVAIKSLGFLGQHKAKVVSESIEQTQTEKSSKIPMRLWTKSDEPRRTMAEYATEDLDEDNIVYKPV